MKTTKKHSIEPGSQPAVSEQPIGVLVIGDWLVDEHWVVGKHRAPSSSRTGREHSRALHREQCSVRSLCGAGQVATILHQAKGGGASHPFKVFGIGIWSPGDRDVLQHMLDPAFNVGRTPHRLLYDEIASDTLEQETGERLFTLVPADSKMEVGTTRVIRIYRHRADHLELEQRIDWELPLTESIREEIRRSIPNTLKPLDDAKISIQHIFVKDLGKGVISEELVHWISTRFGAATWYVSSKVWKPAWLAKVPKSHVRLMIVPQLAAQSAIDSGKISSSSWLTRTGVPSEDALKAINELKEEYRSAKIVVLPQGMSVLARDGDRAYVLATSGRVDMLPFTPMASVFYPALGAHLIAASDLDFLACLQNSISFTSTWEAAEALRTKREDWKPTSDQTLTLPASPPTANQTGWRDFAWSRLEKQWEQAFSNLGVVTVTERGSRREEFQLWRAMTDLPKYVTCIPAKRKHVRMLLREGNALIQTLPKERKNKSFYLVDSPGAGKSFLVERLASTLEMPCLKFNLTTLANRHELTECFQKISAVQSEHPDSSLMVFFDEMNAGVNRQYVFDAFLEPLEDCSYVYNGRTFHIEPCLWLFAGTATPTESSSPANKWTDFESRLTGGVMELNGGEDSAHEGAAGQTRSQLRAVEQIYIGVATIRDSFPDVTKISKKVLDAFALIDFKEFGPRGIRRFVRSFRYVQYGRVMGVNLPEKWADQMRVVPREYNRWLEEDDSESQLVEIKSSSLN